MRSIDVIREWSSVRVPRPDYSPKPFPKICGYRNLRAQATILACKTETEIQWRNMIDHRGLTMRKHHLLSLSLLFSASVTNCPLISC
jgi:hypothetical protein